MRPRHARDRQADGLQPTEVVTGKIAVQQRLGNLELTTSGRDQLHEHERESSRNDTCRVISSSRPNELNNRTTTGFVISGGIDIKALIIHIAPEIRYTRWGARHFLDPNGGLSSNQNQAEFLVGITF